VPDLEVLVEGNKRIVRAWFRVPDEDGVLTDPTTLTFTARRQVGGAWQAPTAYVFGTDSEVDRTTGEATGVFDLEFVPEEGTWAVHVQGTGAAHAAGEVMFIVKRAEALV
jgi:hypothetical protein